MKNLAGDKNADESILKELYNVGVRIKKMEKTNGKSRKNNQQFTPKRNCFNLLYI